MNLQPWYDARERLIDYVRNDLQGKDDERLETPPLDRFIVGILHPQRGAGGDLDAFAENDSETHGFVKTNGPSRSDFETDNDANLPNTTRPSSMGITVNVAPNDSTTITASFEATRYIEDENSLWQPEKIKFREVIDLQEIKRTNQVCKIEIPSGIEGLKALAIIRPTSFEVVRITLSLINTNEAKKGAKDPLCWFRPRIVLQLNHGTFTSGRPTYDFAHRDRELRALDFLYRHETNIAIGHGCSVSWQGKGSVTRVETTYFPSHEVPLADPSPGKPGDPYGEYDLRISQFAEACSYEPLKNLCAAYSRWIEEQAARLDSEKVSLHESEYQIGLETLANARVCHERIANGIRYLEDPESTDVRLAFRLMNLAMLEQRRNSSLDDIQAIAWRPFQIAFILMNIPALSDPDHGERNSVDLLWFPTGGGKTEAYLGCIAFSILLRRIRRPESGGVTAIMRYTLRLLTSDQFGRASKLVCALEKVRAQHLPDSRIPISLGMWVGQNTTPNTYKQVKEELSKATHGSYYSGKTPLTYQVQECPSCSARIELKHYSLTNDGLVIACPNQACFFRNGLPLYFVDEDVYEKRPSLIIGTVDKFAQMAWQPQVAQLLGIDEPESSPDLIVQDELHLLSGPLGTMVGHYETALDQSLKVATGHRPKVIAATATIRQAKEQIRAIFDRDSVQFPPAGLDPHDSYFSQSAKREDQGTRAYIGVLAPGTSQMTLLVRLYAALLQGASELEKPDDLIPETWNKVLDTYWTLLGYFNSLRVLGSANLLANSDIPDRIEVLAKRSGKSERLDPRDKLPAELTSRRNSGEIAATRIRMSKSYPDSQTPSIVLATNMISVGLDIDRLGLMVVAGQPQNSSEYIQATSRVGRRFPGLVFVAFNANRTRDVSHFESFEFFHRTLYSSVEATTATPFSPRARDRGAHGLLVSGTRLLFPELRAKDSAGEVERFEQEIRETVIHPSVERAKSICGKDSKEAQALESRLEALLMEWVEFARLKLQQGHILEYGKMGKSTVDDDQVLLLPSGSSEGPDRFQKKPPWETLTSLRDVDSETVIVREGQ